ncbi:MAG TPA: ABC transporter substrate-binding protein [Opitutales bacterium]|jgi:ABC-type sugar transport system substrate-binding protein|nr:ABC transporter substrate-binding protein [Opitutales bacterium]
MKIPTISPFRLILALATGCLLLAGCSKSGGITVGFVQTGAESQWRVANTNSIQSEAAKRGITLKTAFADGAQDKQIQAIRDFITQKVSAIVIAPVTATGWDPVLKEAKDANIPVIVEDRSIDADKSLYACFIGSDFIKEGHMEAEWLITATGGKGRILELSGEPGSSAAEDRHKAFVDGIASSNLKIIDSQTGHFKRVEGKQVMEAYLKKYAKGDYDILFAHNDDMALGAIQAIEEAGLKPGKDIMVVSIDGEKEAVQAVADGKINCVVECNPMVGPIVFDAVQNVLAGKPVAPVTYNTDHLFDSKNASTEAPNRPY